MAKSVESLLEDILLRGEAQFEMVQVIRSLIQKQFPFAHEEVKYGGILFFSGVAFCGIFAHKNHVSVEFSRGADIQDDLGFLEGAGKFRRHLKFKTLEDIASQELTTYLTLGYEAACL